MAGSERPDAPLSRTSRPRVSYPPGRTDPGALRHGSGTTRVAEPYAGTTFVRLSGPSQADPRLSRLVGCVQRLQDLEVASLMLPPMSGESRTARLLSVLMPVYNERRTLRTIVGRVLASPTPIPLELIAVDDGSRDGSAEILRALAALDPRVKAVFHERNQGKGAAIQTAIRHMNGDVAIIQD